MDKKVKNIQWEGSTLIMELESGEIFKYEGAYIKSIDYDYNGYDVENVKFDEFSSNIIVDKYPIQFDCGADWFKKVLN